MTILIDGSPWEQSNAKSFLHSFIPLKGRAKLGISRENSRKAAYASTKLINENNLSLLHIGLFLLPPGEVILLNHDKAFD